MMSAAFIVSTAMARSWAVLQRFDPELMIDLGLFSVIFGVAGARLMHVFFDGYFMDYVHMCTDPSKVAWHTTPKAWCTTEGGVWDVAANVCRPKEGDCFAWAKFWAGGLTWYGGLFLAVGYGLYFLKKNKIPLLPAMDMFGVVLPIGYTLGRFGCFLGGCCFGKHDTGFLGIAFPRGSSASEIQFREHLLPHPSLPSLPVLPTQLFEIAGNLLIGLLMICIVNPRKRFHGQTFCISFGLYAILRFAIEYFRADDRGGFFGLSTSQWIGVLFLGVCLALGVMFQKQSKRIKTQAVF